MRPLFLILALSGMFPAHADIPCELLVSFDIDGVLLYDADRSIERTVATTDQFIWFNRSRERNTTTYHVKSPWAALVLLALKHRLAACLGFFSLHESERNVALLQRLKIDASVSALALAEGRLFSHEDAVRERRPGVKGSVNTKRLTVYGHPMSHLIHVDDSPFRISIDEQPNLLHVIGRKEWRLPQEPEKLGDFVVRNWVDKYKLVRVLGLIDKALEVSRATGITPVQALYELQYRDGVYQFEATHAPSFYLRGIALMEQVAVLTTEPCAWQLQLSEARIFWNAANDRKRTD